MSSRSEKPQEFRGALEKFHGNGLNWTILRIPFSIEKTWGVRGVLRVHVNVNRFDFSASLLPTGNGEHYLIVNKKIQKAAKIAPGMIAIFRMSADRTPRELKTPAELERALSEDRALKKWFEQLSPSMRREIGKWVAEAKGAEVRQKRAERLAERMIQAMEGEQEPPPILRRIFQSDPRAEAGWNQLTPTQRRHQLLGIFYYESVEARERRAQKAIELALQAYEKSKVKSKPRNG